jgi:YebC/PmpR family DNA-binding regulatory protein
MELLWNCSCATKRFVKLRVFQQKRVLELMAGHSKWKNIRLHKGKADVERGKLFGKLSREITIAARQGGGNTDSNARLRLAVDKARASAMPAENIKRAIQKGTGELASENFEEVSYEGYGPGGVAVLVNAATDNKNRTVADLRHLLSRHGGNLGESGSVAWQFERKGIITVESAGQSEDKVMEVALEAGADDFSSNDGEYEIVTSPDSLSVVQQALEDAQIVVAAADVQMVPQTTVQLEGEAAQRMLKLMDALEDHDDVQSVAANFDIAENVLQEA